MRLRGFLIALGAALAPGVAAACDLCGCFMGLTPYDNQSSVTVLHRYRVYHGYTGQPHDVLPAGGPGLLRVAHDGHAHGPAAPDPTDFEVYRATELRGRYFLGRRLETSLYVPVVQSTTQLNGARSQLSGLGDVTWLIGYHLVRRIEVEGVQQRLIVGGGLKLPTGAANRRAADGTRYELTHQPGTGTLDQLAWATYIVGYRRAGLSLTATGKRTGRNRWHEGIAPALAGYGSAFYTVALGDDWRLIPSVQGYYEYTDGQTLHGALTGEHARREALLGPGLDVYWRNLSATVSAQRAVWQRGAPDHPQSAGRVVVGLTYAFRQTSYALGQ